MISGLVIGLFAGAVLGFFLFALLAAAKRGDENLGYDGFDPYDVTGRQARVDRALARENVVPLGHTRLGIDSPKRGPATFERPGP